MKKKRRKLPSKEVFDLNKKEENIIRSHMWPLTLFSPPRSREAALVCAEDKICAAREMLLRSKDLETPRRVKNKG